LYYCILVRQGAGHKSMSTTKLVIGFIFWLIITFGVAFWASSYSPGGGTEVGVWYVQIQKPAFTPPNWIFGPVWTLLYAMMATAAWLVWRRSGFAGARTALIIFLIQLALNFLWSWIFFGQHLIGWALLDIVILWIAIFATVILFWQKSILAGTLMIPYLGWVSFAAILNYSIWRLNP
jgi:benzodiazapine receptor